MIGKIAQAASAAAQKIAEANASIRVAEENAHSSIRVAEENARSSIRVAEVNADAQVNIAGIAAKASNFAVKANIYISLIEIAGNLANTAVGSAMRMLEARNEVECQKEQALAMAEIDDMRKDQALKRWTQVSKAIAEYQERLTVLNVNAIAAIGNMNIDLRKKAHDFVIETTQRYEDLQCKGLLKAADVVVDMQQKLGSNLNETKQRVIDTAFETHCAAILRACGNFMEDLNDGLKKLNIQIDKLTENGQKAIQGQIDRGLGDLIPAANSSAQMIEGNSPKQIQG